MKLAVIAANGRSGKIFVELALAAGHSVRAGVRRTNNLAPHKKLEVVECDATKLNDIENLIRGQDAVISLIGHVRKSPANVQTSTIKNLIQAMDNQKIKRIVSLTGTGVRFDGDKITLMDRILNASIALVDPKRIQDGKDHVEELKKSSLDWTVLRVLKLQNTDPKAFILTKNGPAKVIVGRSEVAMAILQILKDNSFIKTAPIISPTKAATIQDEKGVI